MMPTHVNDAYAGAAFLTALLLILDTSEAHMRVVCWCLVLVSDSSNRKGLVQELIPGSVYVRFGFLTFQNYGLYGKMVALLLRGK